MGDGENKVTRALVEAYPKVEANVSQVLDAVKFVTHFTFLPFVIYMGYRVSEPKPDLWSIVNPNPLF